MKKTRLAKFISDNGLASRRAAEKLIEAGNVSVDGIVVKTPVFFVSGTENIEVFGKKIKPDNETRLYAFHKPINTMTTARDTNKRKTVYDFLPKEFRNLKYVGRLDYKTTGLLLLTNDGALARNLTLPSSGIPRTYIADVAKLNDYPSLESAIQGISVDGINYRPMKIKVLSPGVLQVTVTEGKNREVRIVLAACGFPVLKLHRISYGIISLGNLLPGEIIEIKQKEIDVLLKSL